jgi:hypothetical protein
MDALPDADLVGAMPEDLAGEFGGRIFPTTTL